MKKTESKQYLARMMKELTEKKKKKQQTALNTIELLILTIEQKQRRFIFC